MLKKGNKLYSILTGKCPKCHQESMYQTKNSYAMSKVFLMHERCSHCSTKYKIEPSFFYGAMYVSYAVGVAFAVATFIISYVIISASLTASFFAIVIMLLVLMPVIMRLSRNIWINFFIHYDKDASVSSQID